VVAAAVHAPLPRRDRELPLPHVFHPLRLRRRGPPVRDHEEPRRLDVLGRARRQRGEVTLDLRAHQRADAPVLHEDVEHQRHRALRPHLVLAAQLARSVVARPCGASLRLLALVAAAQRLEEAVPRLLQPAAIHVLDRPRPGELFALRGVQHRS